MTNKTDPIFLNRFTTIPLLKELLEKKQLVLRNPNAWEDKNDSFTLELYRKKMKMDSVYALCFAHGSKTIHFWKAFANSVEGCCIEFRFSR